VVTKQAHCITGVTRCQGWWRKFLAQVGGGRPEEPPTDATSGARRKGVSDGVEVVEIYPVVEKTVCEPPPLRGYSILFFYRVPPAATLENFLVDGCSDFLKIRVGRG
jgi:hypothetical protein